MREIEVLMRPAAYNGRDGHRRDVRHESGEIIIPLGATTGIPQAITETADIPSRHAFQRKKHSTPLINNTFQSQKRSSEMRCVPECFKSSETH